MHRKLLQKYRLLGGDGVRMLLLSNLLLLASGGLTLLWQLGRVYRTGRGAPVECRPGSLLLVFGMRLQNGAITPDFERRLQRAATLYQAGLGEQILLLGGITDGGTLSEAMAGSQALTAVGVPRSCHRLEDASRHTLENLVNARRLIEGERPEGVVLVSNRYHLARTSALAEGLGIRHQLCAAEPRWQLSPGNVLRLLSEAYYLHWYRVGSAWSSWTGNEKSLRRIR